MCEPVITGGPGARSVPVVLNIYGTSPRITNVIPNPSWGPAEIEFSAVPGDEPEFHLLQIRPLTVMETTSPVEFDEPLVIIE